MINSKEIKNTNIKAIRDIEATEDEFKPWEIRVQKMAARIDKLLKNVLPKYFYYKIDILDDLKLFKPKYALECFVERWTNIITLKQFRYKLGHGIEYFKRGFNSHDFDSAYAMDDFIWKLKRLGKIMYDEDRHVGDKQQAEKIFKTIDLLERVMADDYLDEFEEELAEKYGDNIRYEARADGLFGFFNEGKGPFKNKHVAATTLRRREKWTPENHYEIEKAERVMYKKAHNKRKREWKRALKLIEDNFFHWWD